MLVFVVVCPGEDISVYSKLDDALEHTRDLCCDWHVDFGDLERFELDATKHPLVETVGRIETPEGMLVIESCEVKR